METRGHLNSTADNCRRREISVEAISSEPVT